MTAISTSLPSRDAIGKPGHWLITGRDSRSVRFSGLFLGLGSTHRPEHKGHDDEPFAPRLTHCSTCRWTEIRIFRDRDRSLYVIVSRGASAVPGETDRVAVREAESAFETVEALAVFDERLGRPVLHPHARRALAQAAQRDAGLRDAYTHSPLVVQP
jgi:hypothetical protein